MLFRITDILLNLAKCRRGLVAFVIFPAILAYFPVALAQEAKTNTSCLECHSDQTAQAESGKSIFVDSTQLHSSVHMVMNCVDCHDQTDANFDEVPHFPTYKTVDCQSCHRVEGETWMEYFYKMLKDRGQEGIPDCKECHGTHNAQKELSMKLVCDRCHQEIAAKYRQSYHFQKYQEDTRRYPICTTCHDAHFKSKKEVMSEKEFKQEIVDICSKCHQRDIETYLHSRHYHEMEAGNAKAPVCTSCHENHDIRKPSDPLSRVNLLNLSNVCNGCHPGHKESLHHGPGVDPASISCATCHTGHQTDMASINNSIFKEGGIVNRCNICHSSERHTRENLAHGKLMLLNTNGEEANCTQCHIYHWNLPGLDNEALKHRRTECVNCHAQENRDYKKSIHGRARAQGITEAPTCTTCHGEKDIQKTKEQFTSEGIIKLCSSCHGDKDKMLKFQVNPYVVEGYKETYHGKLFETGTMDIKFAVCTNCHGVHTIQPPDDPESSVSREHIVQTCKQCHPRANDRFVSYLVHPIKPTQAELQHGTELASKDSTLTSIKRDSLSRGYRKEDRGGWAGFNSLVTTLMTLLLIGVLGVFGFHTVLWFQRGIRPRVRPMVIYYSRIDPFHRFLHVLINISFLTLAFTGLPQSYAHTDLAKWLFQNVISLHTAQTLHYIAAAITGFYFVAHIVFLLIKIKKSGWRQLLTGPNTLVARKKDWYDLVAHMKWFFGKGPAPEFDRWTYWEKFDYYAVFWGVFVIGLSGLMRWQEEFFGNLLGGAVISLADTIHKEEALLATAFIFIVHFFNTHLRASKFPMDVSIYTGRISEHEFKEERPAEYDRLAAEGNLEKRQIRPLGLMASILAYAWGTTALLTGFFLLFLIILGHFTAR
jgi:predicted CXXCH cytochrome family protein